MTAVSLIALTLLWFCGHGRGAIPTEKYPDGWPSRQYPTLLHRAIVDGLGKEAGEGLIFAHYPLKMGLGVLLASSNGSTADEVREGMEAELGGPNHNRVASVLSSTDGFKELSYIGAYTFPGLTPTEDYETTIRDMGVDLVQSKQAWKRLVTKLGEAGVHLTKHHSKTELPIRPYQRNEVFLVTAGIFRGAFADADFHKDNRRMRVFNVDERRRTFVETMYSLPKRRQVVHLHNLRASMLVLPFKDSRVKFMVILPDLVEGLHQLEQELEFVDLRTLLTLKMDTRQYDVRLPVINIDENIDLADNLDWLGIRKVFHTEQADLSGITGLSQKMWVQRFHHISQFDLREGGVNWPSHEGHVKTVNHLPGPSKHFFASHPFFFALLDRYNVYATGRYGSLSVVPDDI